MSAASADRISIADPIEALVEAVGGSSRSRTPEPWAWAAFAIFAATAGLMVYLGLRPGGTGPVLAYLVGRDLLGLAALGVGFVGVVWSVLHRPFLRRRRLPAFLGLCAVIGAVGYPLPYPSSHEDHPSQVCFDLPVDGEWTVVWGGEGRDANRLAGYFPDRRFGVDLVVTRDGLSHAEDGLDLADYFAFGREVRAPAEGRVARVHGGMRDTQPGLFVRDVEPNGNFVVIEVAAGEFLFVAHLQQGSIAVREGETVRRGQLLGRVGNSGYSTVTPEPHLAIHLQDTPIPRRGEGIPWRLCRYAADGNPVESGMPAGGVGRDGSFLGQRVSRLSD